jgi:acetylornithine/N-succinyldiaminopimelate aminotransferase
MNNEEFAEVLSKIGIADCPGNYSIEDVIQGQCGHTDCPNYIDTIGVWRCATATQMLGMPPADQSPINDDDELDEFELGDKYLMKTYGRYKIDIERGEGAKAISSRDTEYIDFGAGIGTNSLGYADKDYVNFVADQLSKVQHISNYYYNTNQSLLARALCHLTDMKNVFFCNSGAEANECAIKLARKYSFDKYGKEAERYEIITLENSFHGRTITTLSATGQENFHNYFFPFTPGFVHAKANDIKSFENALSDKTCAVMIELIQGEGGVINLEPEFVKAIYDICGERDILLIVDEVQTGIGRTGAILASDHYGFTPDILTLAKGLAGGLPMGACLAGEKCAETFGKSDHGSTFGGNPVCAAAALNVLGTLCNGDFLDVVWRKGEYIRAKLKDLIEVEDISGMGLMIGIKLRSKSASEVAAKCHEKGLLILTAKEKLRMLPPLNIPYEDIDKGLKILSEILKGNTEK